MEEKEKMPNLDFASEMLNSTRAAEIFSEQRSAQTSDEFTRLEVQIATILFAFVGLFVKFIDTGFVGLPDYGVLVVKVMFALMVFGLIASLIFGLIQLKRKELFWNTLMNQRCARIEFWKEVLRGDATVGEALAFQSGSKLGDRALVTGTPEWPWILQTVCLAGSVALMMLLFVTYLVI